ncbi:MAG: DUF2207 domain-containing protein [Patescibacteria group bacterium]|nr:DUF2207 domain-containing protein [Patescibacteria group bacterium]
MNRKIFFIAAAFVFSFLICQSVLAEQINDFQTSIRINPDASINVTEKIFYDFGDLERRGIYRDIPVKYQRNGLNYNLKISQISVTDENGRADKFSTSPAGKNIRIKIGDADTLISGVRYYVINYTIKRAINYFSDHDELYWNTTGNAWTVDINQVEATVVLPTGVDENKISSACYYGPYGSQTECQSNLSGHAVLYSSANLAAGEGMTIVAGFPKGLVAEPTARGRLIDAIKDNWAFGIPIFALIILFFVWLRFGRDPEDKNPIVAQYDVPDNLTPIEVGTLIDTRADNKDLSAEIIYLAINGYLKIIRQEGVKIMGIGIGADYLLEKLKNSSLLNNDFDRQLLDALVPDKERKLSEIKQDFGAASKFQSVKAAVHEKLDSAGYFSTKTKALKLSLSFAGSLLIGGGIFALIMANSIALLISLIAPGVLFIVLAQFMGQRTVKGVKTENYLKGLKLYLGVVEKDRLEFHNAPEKNPRTFERFLPYAMALGVEKAWAGQFEGIYTEPPAWYVYPAGYGFSVIHFTDDLHSFSSTANMSMAASAQSGGSGMGGGGFSGGGFGGGGGGSW